MTEKKLLFQYPSWQDFPDIELYMDQVISVLERYLSPFFPEEEKCITSTMINNYVKQRLLLPPENKRYGKKHLAYLFMICILKRFMQLSEIRVLLENLVEAMGIEASYALFRTELEEAFSQVYFGNAPRISEEGSGGEKALSTACLAFATISFARDTFLAAGLAPVLSEEEVEEEKRLKEEKKREKKEKKEAKQKEKKEAKEKKE